MVNIPLFIGFQPSQIGGAGFRNHPQYYGSLMVSPAKILPNSIDKARSPSRGGSTIPVLPAMAVDLPRTGLVGWLVGWLVGGSLMYPLVNIQIASENGHLWFIYLVKMVIFHSYV